MESFFDIAFDVLKDAIVDTLYLVPFLFVTYLFMEWLENKTGEKTQRAIARAGTAGPIIGAVLGVVPQCGFSAAASTLYAGRIVGLGTLFAVYLSTSDEMLPIFIAEQVAPSTIIGILAMKIVIGMAFGLLVDLAVRLSGKPHGDLRERAMRKEDPELAGHRRDDSVEGCDHGRLHHDHDHGHDAGWGDIAKSALIHTIQVTLFVFVVSLALDIVLAAVGEEALAGFMGSNEILSVVAAAIVGLIPNCAASVAIAQLYVEGVLGFGACMAGLLSAAGVGFIVLFRANRNVRENVTIVVVLAAFSALCGLVIWLTGIAL